jgi:hypothetical protein
MLSEFLCCNVPCRRLILGIWLPHSQEVGWFTWIIVFQHKLWGTLYLIFNYEVYLLFVAIHLDLIFYPSISWSHGGPQAMDSLFRASILVTESAKNRDGEDLVVTAGHGSSHVRGWDLRQWSNRWLVWQCKRPQECFEISSSSAEDEVIKQPIGCLYKMALGLSNSVVDWSPILHQHKSTVEQHILGCL